MKSGHYRSGRLVAVMMAVIAAVFMASAQAQSDAVDVVIPKPEEVGGWIEHDSKLAEGGWIEHDSQVPGSVKLEAVRMLASPHGSGGLSCDSQGNCRTRASASGTEGVTMMASPHGSGGLSCDSQGNCRTRASAPSDAVKTMFAGISLDPPEPQPLCDTDPYSCFYLVNKDQTLPSGMRNTQQAFLE